jgi:outer membrane protein assembly factor BamB
MYRFFWGILSLILLSDHAALRAEPAADWPQWRGPGRDGHAPGKPWPASFDALRLNWRVPLGKGYPGPIVTPERIFVVETVNDDSIAVRALDRRSGAPLWRVAWPGRGSVPFFARSNGDWVRSTPAWDGHTLYVGDMSEVLVALDADTGQVRWRLDFPTRFSTEVPPFGFASSPLVDGDFLYIQAANSLVKLDKHSGQVLWRGLEIDGGMGSAGAFSSPVLAQLAGVRQVVVQDRNALHGVGAADGKGLWSLPLPHFRGMHILTPTVWQDAVFTSPYRERSYLVRVETGVSGWKASTAWDNKASGYMSSPVVLDGHAYLHLGNKRIECIDLASGQTRWRSKKTFGKYWSMVWRGDRILGLDEDGTLYLLAADPAGFSLLDQRSVAESEAWGHLAVSGDELFVRELEGISSYSWEAQGGQ